MSGRRSRRAATIALIALPALFGFAPQSRAATICDSDAAAVDFEATVNADLLNDFLSGVGEVPIDLGTAIPVTFGGLCTNHRFDLVATAAGIVVDGAPFTVTPGFGSIQVDLTMGGFNTSLGTRNYRTTNCSSICVATLPLVGEVFNGCSVEGTLVGTVVNNRTAHASWDGTQVTQVGDTCVLGDCTAVHPLETTNATLFNFDIDATAFGSCSFCINFPAPFDALDICGNPCDFLDPLITSLLRPRFESALEGAFVDDQGNGVLIDVFHTDITKDFFGCFDIPEVRECRQNSVALAGMAGAPVDRSYNAIFFALPLALAGGLALRLRRRADG